MTNEETFIKKIERNIDDGFNLCHKRPILAAFIIMTILIWMGFQWYSAHELAVKNDELKDENTKLEKQIAPFRAAAAIWFPGDIESGMIKLADKITKLENDIELQRRYADIAKYDFYGSTIVGSIGTGGPLAGWSKQYIKDTSGGQMHITCTQEAIDTYLNVIETNPDFPYPYYIISMCYQTASKKEEWREYATKGVAILEQIVKVPGHVSAHDQCLNKLKEMLAKTPEKK